MTRIAAWGTTAPNLPLAPLTIERRDAGPRDVVIDILFCGICHSDIHQARDEWTGSLYPMVPGHEIVGRVVACGAEVSRIAVGQMAGVGCMVDSCHTCTHCGDGHEQFCVQGSALTYNGTEMDRVTRTYGGYSTRVVVDERFVLRVPESLDPAGAAPLLCAGVTTFSPLRRFGCGEGTRVGVVGLGGLGHMAVKLARSMGAVVTVLSTSPKKEADARGLGATDFLVTTTPDALAARAGSLDLIIDTVSAPHDYNVYLNLLRPHGAMVLVGAPPEPSSLLAFALIMGNRTLAGSVIGGIAETQEMLDHCAAHGIVSDVEIIPIQSVNEAYERVLKSDVRYRFVIDMASLKD
jgi:uncharacterized zinc-type alcohol dehydrogenase-like protein